MTSEKGKTKKARAKMRRKKVWVKLVLIGNRVMIDDGDDLLVVQWKLRDSYASACVPVTVRWRENATLSGALRTKVGFCCMDMCIICGKCAGG